MSNFNNKIWELANEGLNLDKPPHTKSKVLADGSERVEQHGVFPSILPSTKQGKNAKLSSKILVFNKDDYSLERERRTDVQFAIDKDGELLIVDVADHNVTHVAPRCTSTDTKTRYSFSVTPEGKLVNLLRMVKINGEECKPEHISDRELVAHASVALGDAITRMEAR